MLSLPTPLLVPPPDRDLLRMKLRLDHRVNVDATWVAECGGLAGWQAFKTVHTLEGDVKLRLQVSHGVPYCGERDVYKGMPYSMVQQVGRELTGGIGIECWECARGCGWSGLKVAVQLVMRACFIKFGLQMCTV
jgi:hypothetical protein